MIIRKTSLLSFLKYLVPFTVLLCVVQYFLVEKLLAEKVYYSTFIIYGFLFLATLGIYAALLLIYKNFKEKTGYAFMGLSLVKTFLAIIFLLPVIIGSSDNSNIIIDVFTFFIPYFLFLLFETFFAVKLLRNS